ncbi:MAG TPA: carbon-nitrogen hydrolase family protein [Gemmatimonadales bacterium]|nr:carbon-nitrogen hydrolase family protein [Gemmatimonadales bacterium]
MSVVRVTVCELPHEAAALDLAWDGLCHHTSGHGSELVLLPEFAFVEPVWETDRFDPARWDAAVELCAAWLGRLSELRAKHVVGSRPVTVDGRPFNQGFIWSAGGGLRPLRNKFFLPDEPGFREAQWFDRGDATFPAFRAGGLTFGLNICTELWALESYAGYAAKEVPVILSPRATAAATTAKWLSVGVVAAVRSGAFSLSSNRVDPTGACGGVGWIICPEGRILARTSPVAPFATANIDLAVAAAARDGYPRYVFKTPSRLSADIPGRSA